MGVRYSIPENAEVISSSGVALSMVRDVVERIIPSPSKDDIKAIKLEAMNKAIESGATAESVEVHVEIDPQTSKVTAIATGSTEVKTTDLLKECSEEEARKLAADDMRITEDRCLLIEKSRYFYVFSDKSPSEGYGAVRIVDHKGFIKVQRGLGAAQHVKVKDYQESIRKFWDELAVYQTELIVRPDFYLCVGAKVMDFSSTDLEQLILLIDLELSALDPEDEIIIVAANVKQH